MPTYGPPLHYTERRNEVVRLHSRNYCVSHLVPTLRVGMHTENSGNCAAYAFPRGAWERGGPESLQKLLCVPLLVPAWDRGGSSSLQKLLCFASRSHALRGNAD